MALTKWKSLRTGKVLPIDSTVVQFQYRHYINWEVILYSVGISSRDGEGEWHIKLVAPDDTVIFEQIVTVRVNMVSLGSLGSQLFTWSFKNEVINTISFAGTPIGPDNPSWQYTIGGTPLSEFGTMEAGGGANYTDIVAYVTDWWDSPVYKLNIPVGTKLVVVRDSWGLGAATRPEWQWRFKEGAFQLVDSVIGPFGERVVARGINLSTSIQGGHSWSTHKVLRGFGYVKGATDPTLVVMGDGRRIMGLLQHDGFWEYESRDMERSWQKVKYPSEVPGERKEMAIFGPEVTMPQCVRLEKTRLYLVVRGNKVRVRRVFDDGPGELVTAGSVKTGETYSIDVDGAGVASIVDTSGLPIWQSETQGKSYEKVAPDDETEEPDDEGGDG